DNYGVFNGLPDIRHSSLFAETDLSGRWIAHQAAVNILNEKNLWQEMAHILTQRLMVLSMRERELLGVDSYQMVRILLM
ncbi:cytoplasmic protein, partial [Acinetobacter baumannii]|nr:cytoplasmic protein [Acinetobacter baumannii]